jgi:hypothetical protein
MITAKRNSMSTAGTSGQRSTLRGQVGLKQQTSQDKVVLSKTILSNFCPKQANEWIGNPMASLFQLFIAFPT